MHRRKFIGVAGLSLLAACNSGKILQACASLPALPPSTSQLPNLRDVYIVNDFGGVQSGTQSNPYAAKTAAEWDALMKSLSTDDFLRVHLTGSFLTAGTYEFGTYAGLGWHMGKHWQIEGNGSSLKLDPTAIPDGVIDSAPLHMLVSRDQTAFPETSGMTPAQVWDGLGRGQAVRNLTLDRSFTALVDRWKAKGDRLCGGSVLSGHRAAWDGCTFLNHGTLGQESFPAAITGAIGAPDRDKIAQLDPATHVLEEASIVSCVFDGYDPSASNDQVTVFIITGNIGEPGGWNTGGSVHTFRRNAILRNNTVRASGKNLVQGYTIYQTQQGSVSGNLSDGAYVGYYGDFYQTRGIDISSNTFLNTLNGIRILLSPTPVPLASNFYHENYSIGPNRITSSDVDVYIDTLGQPTGNRYIRNMGVDEALSLRYAGADNVYRTKGC